MVAIAASIVAFISMFVPGILLSYALLKKTKELHTFEIIIIGIIFGLVAPATMTWLESYLISYIHALSFSLGLFELNALVLTIIGIILCYQQGLFNNLVPFITGEHKAHQPSTDNAHQKKQMKVPNYIWIILLVVMLLTFATRMLSYTTAPKFFEFDPYFDMIDAKYILTYGQQLLLDPSAWPVVAAGTNHRIEPLVPYLEAYWYDLANHFGSSLTSFSPTLMSQVGGIYPPITAALLVFVIFMLVYHEYGYKIGLICAGLTASMPVLFTTFVAGEQLVEPWGIFTLFFFFAAYMLAIRDMKSKRLAILAGLAFVTTFLGAHYYTVDTGVLVVYILVQGLVDIIRGDMTKDFYKMNIIVLAIIAIFLAVFLPYGSTLQNRIPSLLGIPITISGPVVALIFVAIMDYVPKLLKSRNIIFKNLNAKTYLLWIIFLLIIAIVAIFATPLGKPIEQYIILSKHFTTPSTPLFMTVEEYIPTGLTYNFGANGFGMVGASIFGLPIVLWLVVGISFVLIIISMIFGKSKTGILYFAIALPLMFAGFSEVKYLPHFGTALIMLFGIMIGEIIFLAESNFNLGIYSKRYDKLEEDVESSHKHNHKTLIVSMLLIGLFFVSTILAIALLLICLLVWNKDISVKHMIALLVIFIAVLVIGVVLQHSFMFGESSSIIQAFTAAQLYATNPTGACNTLSSTSSIGTDLYCTTVPQYWLDAMSWINVNVGPYGPRVLAWWDYGDWINWFGNSNAVLRGDNAVATEDYATAATYVLGQKDGYGPAALAAYMNSNQSKYVLFDQDLIQKWQALDFLACVNVNATSRAFAIQAGQQRSPPVQYELGTSQCEISHDPQFVLLPLPALVSQEGVNSVNFYCSLTNSTSYFVRGFLLSGNGLSNQTVCINISATTKNGAVDVYNENGTKVNAMIQVNSVQGFISVSNVTYVEFMMVYYPNAANGTITDAPSQFYESNYYKGFVLGNLPGFTLVYPTVNATGINFINNTDPVRIYEVNNFTGTLPTVPAKPSWIHNNYTMP